jgi:hypothetical protein
MNSLKQHATVEILVVSGSLRIVVRPSPGWLSMLFQAAIIALFGLLSLRSWQSEPLLVRIPTVAVVIGGIGGWFAQLFGFSEEIEFDQKSLRVRTETFGWERTREYPIEQCSDLQVQDLTGDAHGLQCRIGWRTIEFGDYLSEQQAIEVLSALQDALPEVVPKLLHSVDITKLGLGPN